MENIVQVTENTISLVVFVISTISFDENEAHFDLYRQISKLKILKTTILRIEIFQSNLFRMVIIIRIQQNV